MTLTKKYYETYTLQKQSYSQHMFVYGLHHLQLFKEREPQAALQEIATRVPASLQSSMDQMGGRTFFYVRLVLFVVGLALAWHWARAHRAARFLLSVGAFSLGVGVWHILLNGHHWYRYFYPADFAQIIFIVCMLDFAIQRFISTKKVTRMEHWMPYVPIGLLVLLALLQGHYKTVTEEFVGKKEARLVQRDVARHVLNSSEKDFFFGFGWFQAPQIQVQTGVHVYNLADPIDLKLVGERMAPESRYFFIAGPNLPDEIFSTVNQEYQASALVPRQHGTALIELDREAFLARLGAAPSG